MAPRRDSWKEGLYTRRAKMQRGTKPNYPVPATRQPKKRERGQRATTDKDMIELISAVKTRDRIVIEFSGEDRPDLADRIKSILGMAICRRVHPTKGGVLSHVSLKIEELSILILSSVAKTGAWDRNARTHTVIVGEHFDSLEFTTKTIDYDMVKSLTLVCKEATSGRRAA